jgi:hypothetical protein
MYNKKTAYPVPQTQGSINKNLIEKENKIEQYYFITEFQTI